ncbi:6442_t:CDS:2 [Diversispora eburnea]|uniref:6442_t:CDS:1 n=1 Tax=Diversispora eburnea TaxID=1213867 RepID=A0A9N9AP52_9GLOM|nr:6442_t:CDS:2 [Diversispora eburnea]
MKKKEILMISQSLTTIDIETQTPEQLQEKGSKYEESDPQKARASFNLKRKRNLPHIKIDLIITIGLYYTFLIANALTLSTVSSSFFEFLFNLLIGSFALTQWKFGQLDLIGRITGFTLSLQILILLSVLGIFAYTKFTKKPIPIFKYHQNQEGESDEEINDVTIYYGGPFQIVHIFKSYFVKGDLFTAYYSSIKNLDAQLSQFIGILSCFLIILAALFIEIPNDTDTINKTTYKITITIIILLAILNILQWLADMFRVDSDEIIFYAFIKSISSCRGERKPSKVIPSREILVKGPRKGPTPPPEMSSRLTQPPATTGSTTVVKTTTGITASPSPSPRLRATSSGERPRPRSVSPSREHSTGSPSRQYSTGSPSSRPVSSLPSPNISSTSLTSHSSTSLPLQQRQYQPVSIDPITSFRPLERQQQQEFGSSGSIERQEYESGGSGTERPNIPSLESQRNLGQFERTTSVRRSPSIKGRKKKEDSEERGRRE